MKITKKEINGLNVYEFILNGKLVKYTYAAIISRINTFTLKDSKKELEEMIKIKEATEKLKINK